jgi:hypothetical protein
MRSVLVCAAAVAMLTGCKKGSLATAPGVADSFTVAGSWSGCITEPHVSCSPVSMTLSDSSLTDTTATVTGTGNWGANVAIHGKINDSKVSLDAATEGVLQGWSFSGILSGASIAGNMTIPGLDSTYQAVFTRTP